MKLFQKLVVHSCALNLISTFLLVFQTVVFLLSNFFMVFNVTFNTISVISWRSVLLVVEIVVPGENHRPFASH
jgi:hypothetical protein